MPVPLAPRGQDPAVSGPVTVGIAFVAPPGQCAAVSTPDDGDTLKLDEQLCVPLYVASRLVTQAYRPLLDRLGLTYPQFVVMMVLWESDGASVREIGERLSLDSGTLTPVLKRLVAAELIFQERTSDDSRSLRNVLAPRGLALKAEAARVPGELLCAVDLPMDDLVQLREQLKQLIAKLQRHLTVDDE